LRVLFEERTVQRMAKAVDEVIALRQQAGMAEIDDVLGDVLQEIDEMRRMGVSAGDEMRSE
jgi:hypothetical protein